MIEKLRKFSLDTVRGGLTEVLKQFQQLRSETFVVPPKTAFEENRHLNRYNG